MREPATQCGISRPETTANYRGIPHHLASSAGTYKLLVPDAAARRAAFAGWTNLQVVRVKDELSEGRGTAERPGAVRRKQGSHPLGFAGFGTTDAQDSAPGSTCAPTYHGNPRSSSDVQHAALARWPGVRPTVGGGAAGGVRWAPQVQAVSRPRSPEYGPNEPSAGTRTENFCSARLATTTRCRVRRGTVSGAAPGAAPQGKSRHRTAKGRQPLPPQRGHTPGASRCSTVCK